jgi:hypothetical protein
MADEEAIRRKQLQKVAYPPNTSSIERSPRWNV